MTEESMLLAKTAALKKNFDSIQYINNRCLGQAVEPYFDRYFNLVNQFKKISLELYGDIPEFEIPKPMGSNSSGKIYEKHTINPLVQNLDYILELNSNIRIGTNNIEKMKKSRVFISHGRSKEWHKVQNYLEKDLEIKTLELAQEANGGRTVLQKLDEEAENCSVAIIVMTGEDITDQGDVRARENVMHEIGFFQGRYGLKNVVLLHEEGVNIPSNIQGLVYIGFPKDTVEAALGALTREMKVLI